jgi:hypothetical protein
MSKFSQHHLPLNVGTVVTQGKVILLQLTVGVTAIDSNGGKVEQDCGNENNTEYSYIQNGTSR